MSENLNRTYYFWFAYHHPGGWEASERDLEFDYSTTSMLPIRAPSEAAALEWGNRLAKWYVTELYRQHPDLSCEWSPDTYPTWVEESPSEGCEDLLTQIDAIDVASYPDFETVKLAFAD